MPLDAFPDITEDYGTEPDPVKPNVQRLAYGDGYSQRIGLGLNQIAEGWNMLWSERETADKDTIITFLKAKGGKEAFTKTPIGEAVARQYTCPEWKATPLPGGLWTIIAKFVEEFDL